jgi:two-component system, cell cycle sensor histidine kinase and response regulator CckA
MLSRLQTLVRRELVITAAAVAIFLGQFAAIVLIRDAWTRSLAANIAQGLASLLVGVAALRARRRFSEKGRRFWNVIALSFFSWTLLQAAWMVQENFFGSSPLLSVTQLLFYFSFMPMLFHALWESDVPPSRVLKALDIAQILVSAFLLFIFAFVLPHRTSDAMMQAESFFVAMNLRNLVLCAAFFLQGCSSAAALTRQLFRGFAILLTIYTLGNALSGYAILFLHVGDGTFFDFGWILPFLLMALAAASSNPPPPADARAATNIRSEAWRATLNNVLPLAIPIAVIALATRIATLDLRAAIAATLVSLILYGVRTARTQFEQVQALRRLQETEGRFMLLFTQHPLPMWVFDRKTHRFLEANNAAVEKYGYTREEFLNLTTLDIRPPEDVPSYMALRGRFSERIRLKDIRHRTKDGRIFYVEITAQGVKYSGRDAVLVVAVDTSDRAVLEEQLRQVQKMEAVGRLAGGIAHDFNNILTVISGYSSVLLDTATPDSKEARQIGEIHSAAQKAASLTRQLLAFSRRQIMQPQPINLNLSITSAARMIERLIGENIRVSTRLAPTLGVVMADPAQLDQVILNLAVNARDAMPRGGELVFETSQVLADDAATFGFNPLPPRDYVLLRVADTGSGIPLEIMPHIFEPFFTTKETGKGTGLGLATVYGVIKQSNGYIYARSEPGRGAEFFVFLPLARVEDHVTGDEVAASPRRPGEGRVVLLVEDEPAVRELTRHVLAKAGYEVLAAANAAEAEQICRSRIARIDVLLTDVVMPGDSGYQLASLLTALRPSMKALLMTGYAEEMTRADDAGPNAIGVLHKPFTPDVLLQRVTALLENETMPLLH